MQLFEYQTVGADTLAANQRFLLADDMGLGKSAQAIRAADKLGLKKLLIVCPAIARVNWSREVAKFGLVKRIVHVIMDGKKPIPADAETVICNYDLLPKRISDLRARDWDVLVLDEIHLIKNPEAIRTKAIVGSTKFGPGVIVKCQRVWGLSGTLMPNHSGELWVVSRAIVPQIARSLGITNYESWLERFTIRRPTDWGWLVSRSINLDVLSAAMKPYMLRRTKVEVLKDLPPYRVSDWMVEADEAALKAARMGADSKDEVKLLKSVYADLQGGTSLEALEPALASLRRLVARLKCKGVAEMVVERLTADPSEKIVIFGIHRNGLDLLQDALKDFGIARVDGSVTGEKRQRQIDTFQTDPNCRVFLAQSSACATAVTLTAASVAVFLELDFTPANNQQCVGRLHRIGQKRSVEVIIATLADSVDEVVNAILGRKLRDIRDFYLESEGRVDALSEFDELA